ncbi:phage terminase large subunit [Alistipes sp. OttesenSCG-928-L06]|nr:phage terminase large subunit [Alistipes sp. OttesenSCG-928-L06]
MSRVTDSAGAQPAVTLSESAKRLTKKEIQAEKSRRRFPDFVRTVLPKLSDSDFHRRYYEVLDRFARGEIRRLIVTIPPQHGKSQGATVGLPAYLLGRDPTLRIAVASYNLSLAARFNRQIQRLMDTRSYRSVFPAARLKTPGSRENYIRSADEFEVVGHGGGVISVGREGALTGSPVDVMVIDDLYKDALEAYSPVIRDNAWEWYVSVVRTRLHNDSRELIVMTRWHDDDLIGRLIRKESVEMLTDLSAIDPANTAKKWFLLNFEALKEGDPTPLDPRRPGEALWPERQNAALLNEKRALDPATFESMYQGRPTSREGLLYGPFATYSELPRDTLRKANYTDTADTGDDFLCSVCYETGKDGLIYVTDVVYTQLSMEHTEEAVAAMLTRNETRVACIESNNGGRGFARNVAKLCRLTKVEWFTQSGNKESRILTNAPTVLKHISMPSDWAVRWPELHRHLTGYRRTFRSNRWHDAADVLTGIVEREVVNRVDKSLKKVRFSLR